jgi:hypothetical protein
MNGLLFIVLSILEMIKMSFIFLHQHFIKKCFQMKDQGKGNEHLSEVPYLNIMATQLEIDTAYQELFAALEAQQHTDSIDTMGTEDTHHVDET